MCILNIENKVDINSNTRHQRVQTYFCLGCGRLIASRIKLTIYTQVDNTYHSYILTWNHQINFKTHDSTVTVIGRFEQKCSVDIHLCLVDRPAPWIAGSFCLVYPWLSLWFLVISFRINRKFLQNSNSVFQLFSNPWGIHVFRIFIGINMFAQNCYDIKWRYLIWFSPVH